MEKSKTNRLLALLNLAGFIVTVIFNALANALPLNGKDTGELSDAYPNLFVPAGFTFSIWGLIYLLLAGFVVYQLVMSFRTGGDSWFMQKIGPWFLISSAANTLWIIAWHWEQVLLSVLIMLALLASLIIIYSRINSENTRPKPAEYLFVRLPFSVYLGWITVATIANITALLVNTGWNRFGFGEQFWTVAVLAAAVLITLLVLITRKDTAYALVIIWAFAGILVKRRAYTVPADTAVETAVIIGIILLGAAVVYTAARKIPSLSRK